MSAAQTVLLFLVAVLIVTGFVLIKIFVGGYSATSNAVLGPAIAGIGAAVLFRLLLPWIQGGSGRSGPQSRR
jgi:hypothetical protein